MRRGGSPPGLGVVGRWYVLLTVLCAGGALALSQRYGLDTPGTAVTLLITVPPAYLAWKAFLHDRADASRATDLGTVADHLAEAVKVQWDAEARIRRINDPYPLPVAWRAADIDLVEDWGLLTDIALSVRGCPPSDLPDWPTGPDVLAGNGAEIGDVFSRRVPTRRLLVLGNPGAGKTVLLLRLLADLIDRRTPHDPVPVLFSLASWNPVRQELDAWMAEQLRRNHPGLTVPWASAPSSRRPADLAQALLEHRLVLPILDGFDEIPPALQAPALDAVNRALPLEQPMVLASRTPQYRSALTRRGIIVRLNGAAGIQLLPLERAEAAAYLRRDAGGAHTAAAERWSGVAELLGGNTPVGQALSTPLGLFLARTVYNPRPGPANHAAPPPDPDRLRDTTAYPTRAAVLGHLFDAFIPAAYAATDREPSRWSAEQAHRTLVFLARHLETNRAGSPDLAWWELHHALPPRTRRRAVGLAAGLPVGAMFGLPFVVLAGYPDGLRAGSAIGGVIGLVFTLAGFMNPPAAPAVRLRWSLRGFASGLRIGLLTGFGTGLLVGLFDAPLVGLQAGITIGSGIGAVAAYTGALSAANPDLTVEVGPATVLARDRRTFGQIILTAVLGPVLACTALLGLSEDEGLTSDTLMDAAFFGTLLGLAGGLAAGLTVTAWGTFTVTRAHLGLRRHIPRDLLAFLKDAHETRGVLRQIGAVYQFRHIDLQRHLGQQPPSDSTDPAPPEGRP
ncbi:NACHT domain-containing protein [Streptomyces rubradiris]|uniref:NACHT domain-containing protein n=1 Tax=Streptomyces rubradiris TaxID=285531 RepID=UPI0036EF4B65